MYLYRYRNDLHPSTRPCSSSISLMLSDIAHVAHGFKLMEEVALKKLERLVFIMKRDSATLQMTHLGPLLLRAW